MKRGSLFERLLVRPKHPGVINALVLLLFFAPVAASWVDGSLPALAAEGRWRGLLIPPVVIAYILLVSRWMAHVEDEVLAAFRPVVLIDDTQYGLLVAESRQGRTRTEALVLALGAVVGVASASLIAGDVWT